MVRLLTLASIAAIALSALAHSDSPNRVYHRRSSLARRYNNVNTNDTPAPRAPLASASRKRGTKVARCSAKTTTAASSDSTDDASNTDDSSTQTSSGSNTDATATVSGGGDPQATGSTSEVASAAALLPGSSKGGWTVSKAAVSDITKLTLTDDTFITVKADNALPHPVVPDPQDGQPAIHAHFEKGAYDLKASPAGGFSFYSYGPKSSSGSNTPILDMSKAKEISFGYSVKFSEGYDFNLGGKLPGLYGGTDPNVAATCSGGRHAEGCFSTRFMFRPGGAGELYLYIPPSQNRPDLCGKNANVVCPSDDGKTYGASMGTGLWHFTPGQYTSMRQLVHLNTPGQRDGWVKVFVDGAAEPVFTVSDISFRSEASSVFVGLQMQTFHGGHEPNWAPSHAQDSYFRDFSIAITE